MSTGTSFQPRTCDCSFAPYRHVVKTKAEWNRHLAKQHQDAAENIPADVVLTPPQPQYLKFRAVEVEEEEYLVATEPEFLETKQPNKRGSGEDMDEDMEVLRLPKRRHTEPSVDAEPRGEVESGVEASRWMEEPILEPAEDEYGVMIRELHNEYDVPPQPPDDVPLRPPDNFPPRAPDNFLPRGLDDVPPRPPDDVPPSATAQAPPSVRLYFLWLLYRYASDQLDSLMLPQSLLQLGRTVPRPARNGVDQGNRPLPRSHPQLPAS
jgi:hypothetical protein